ncbi:flavin-nucleotide-binding, partial [Fusarium albosuccineum]
MGRLSLEYPKTATNTVRRYGERGFYELETIHSIINTAKMLYVSFNAPNSPFPVMLPMIGIMGSYDRPSAGPGEALDLYLHGYVTSRMLNVGRSSTGKGMPVSVATCHIDGLVLALSAFSHNFNYRSAALFGYATLVEDEAEKLYVMERVTNKFIPDHWRNTRLPPSKREVQILGVLKVKIVSGSAKIRTGQADDEIEDMENESVVGRFWTGVLPLYQVMGEPIPSSYNPVNVLPHIAKYQEEFNNDNKEEALAAVEKEEGPVS